MTIVRTRVGAVRRLAAGFTLLQLMLVVALIGILAAVALGLPPASAIVRN
jgi:type II secretory pathway pseudopilin PulG